MLVRLWKCNLHNSSFFASWTENTNQALSRCVLFNFCMGWVSKVLVSALARLGVKVSPAELHFSHPTEASDEVFSSIQQVYDTCQQGPSLLKNFGGTILIVCASMTSPCSLNRSTMAPVACRGGKREPEWNSKYTVTRWFFLLYVDYMLSGCDFSKLVLLSILVFTYSNASNSQLHYQGF